MWNTLPFEDKMFQSLKRDLGDEKGKRYFRQYVTARDKLLQDNFFKNIPVAEPNLTDHSEKHIANVIENADKLLGKELKNVSGISLYCLGLMILFHDVGNINGREKHNKNIADVYNFVRNKESKFNRERSIIIQAGEADCGRSTDGSRDTLKDLDEIDHFDGERINLRDLAAILRLADELAEGPQRTSQYMLENRKYADASDIYHKYASVTHIFIDRDGGRLSITYEIDYDTEKMQETDIISLLKFTFERILKIDEERRYNKHYCDLLLPFKKTSIKYNFTVNGLPINLDIGRIEIKDRFPIPGEDGDAFNKLVEKNQQLDCDKIMDQIKQTLNNNKND